jgi:hypothetical protein
MKSLYVTVLMILFIGILTPIGSSAQDRPGRQNADREKPAQNESDRGQRDSERQPRDREPKAVVDDVDSTAARADRGRRPGANPMRTDTTGMSREDRMAVLATRIESARQKERERHDRRLARIAEIRTEAEKAGDADALARVDELVKREAAQHERKMQQLATMEERMTHLRESPEKPRQESESRRDSTRRQP